MNDFLCFWNKSQVLSIYSVLGDKLYDKRKPIPQWVIYKSLCLNCLLCWFSTVINNSRQRSGYLLQMRLLAYCREDSIFLYSSAYYSISALLVQPFGASGPFVASSNPASGNGCCHRHRLHAVPRMWYFLRSGLCFSRAYGLSEEDRRTCFTRQYSEKTLK